MTAPQVPMKSIDAAVLYIAPSVRTEGGAKKCPCSQFRANLISCEPNEPSVPNCCTPQKMMAYTREDRFHFVVAPLDLSRMELWIPITIAAAFLQNLRSAMQKHLKGVMGTTGATFVRFGFGFPFALAFVWVLNSLAGYELPAP